MHHFIYVGTRTTQMRSPRRRLSALSWPFDWSFLTLSKLRASSTVLGTRVRTCSMTVSRQTHRCSAHDLFEGRLAQGLAARIVTFASRYDMSKRAHHRLPPWPGSVTYPESSENHPRRFGRPFNDSSSSALPGCWDARQTFEVLPSAPEF